MEQSEHPILAFWFGPPTADGQVADETKARWFKKSPEFDALCKASFESEVEAVARGERESMKDSPRGTLAYILLCDQMSRNIYRDTPGAFALDGRALAATRQLIDSGSDMALAPSERFFAYMPLMHSEERAVHELSIQKFDALAKDGMDSGGFAQKHKAIVDRFGRYPHRNVILGRESTPEEIEFLQQPGSSF